MTPKEILTSARNRIANPANWTQHTNARRADGEPVAVTDPTACCWCAMGSLLYEYRARGHSDASNEIFCAADDLLDKAALELFHSSSYIALNDTHDHAAVLAVYDRVIELAQEP